MKNKTKKNSKKKVNAARASRSMKGKWGKVGAPPKKTKFPNGKFTMEAVFNLNPDQCELSLRKKVDSGLNDGSIYKLKNTQFEGAGRPPAMFVKKEKYNPNKHVLADGFVPCARRIVPITVAIPVVPPVVETPQETAQLQELREVVNQVITNETAEPLPPFIVLGEQPAEMNVEPMGRVERMADDFVQGLTTPVGERAADILHDAFVQVTDTPVGLRPEDIQHNTRVLANVFEPVGRLEVAGYLQPEFNVPVNHTQPEVVSPMFNPDPMITNG
jgi:hypothetical protein